MTASSAKPILIVGTDTGVGKTWVGCALGSALRVRGCHAIAIKPVETGLEGSRSGSSDAALLAASTGQASPKHAFIELKSALTPADAAEIDHCEIDWAQLVQWTKSYAQNSDVLIVESAGGLLSPITWERNACDLAEELDAMTLLVACDKLGTINHVLLTIHMLTLRNVQCAGVVLTPGEKADTSTGRNAPALRKLVPYPIWNAPRCKDPHETAHNLDEVIAWFL